MATKKPARKTKGLKKAKKLEANKPLSVRGMSGVRPRQISTT